MTKTTAYSSVPGGETTHYPVSETTGDILSFPHNYHDSKAQEVHFSDGNVYRAEQLSQDNTYPTPPHALSGAKEFANALYDICTMEGNLEKRRRELALQPDFNMCDTYKMFLRL